MGYIYSGEASSSLEVSSLEAAEFQEGLKASLTASRYEQFRYINIPPE